MTNENIKSQKATADHVAEVFKAKPLVVETQYTREEIQAAPSAFGVMPEVLAGALALIESEKLSRDQVVKAIDAFKNRKV